MRCGLRAGVVVGGVSIGIYRFSVLIWFPDYFKNLLLTPTRHRLFNLQVANFWIGLRIARYLGTIAS